MVLTLSPSSMAAMGPGQSSSGVHPQYSAASAMVKGPSTIPMSRSSLKVCLISAINCSAEL